MSVDTRAYNQLKPGFKLLCIKRLKILLIISCKTELNEPPVDWGGW